MKNKVIKELLEVKKYTNDSIKFITDYVNKLGSAVSEDITAVLKELKGIKDRIGVIEDKLGIEKPKQIETVVEDVKDEEVKIATKGVKVGRPKKAEAK